MSDVCLLCDSGFCIRQIVPQTNRFALKHYPQGEVMPLFRPTNIAFIRKMAQWPENMEAAVGQ